MNYKRLAQNRIKKAHDERIKRIADKYDDRIKHLKEMIKKEDVYLEKCKEYGKDADFIDGVSVSFSDDLDVSAKTINGEILLNGKLFNEEIIKQIRYLQHEFTHVLQQDAGKVKGKTDKADYLDDENEQEAFTAQIAYMCEHEDAEEIQEYIENLLDHHGIQGAERKEKAKKLVEKL